MEGNEMRKPKKYIFRKFSLSFFPWSVLSTNNVFYNTILTQLGNANNIVVGVLKKDLSLTRLTLFPHSNNNHSNNHR